MLDSNPLLVISFADTFSHSVGCLHFVDGFLHCAKKKQTLKTLRDLKELIQCFSEGINGSMGMIISVNMSELFMCMSTSACDFASSKFR